MDSAQTLDLLPCPFCGGTDFYARGIDGMPYCGNCGAQSGRLDWNTRAALPAPAVKPLVWQNFDAWTFWAESLCGTYYVTERNGTWIAELKSQGSVRIIYEIDDFDTAKAAAQADYEARIRSALTTEGEG